MRTRAPAFLATAALAVTALLPLSGAPTARASAPPTATPAAAARATPYVPPPLVWGACTDPTLVFYGAECSTLTVPVDYDNPRGLTLHLAVSRIRHRSSPAAYQGVMLVNPGGPGISGLVYSVLGQFVPHGAGRTYDWIGFDPRAVGSSEPALSCDSHYFDTPRPGYVPSSPRLEQAWFDKTTGYSRDCATAGGILLDHMRTTDWVADLESLRIALGQRQINYYGMSYGTYLGQVYATRHPERVRRFVLDSNISPQTVWYQFGQNQTPTFAEAITSFWSWVAEHDDVYHLGTSPGRIADDYTSILARLRQHPALGGRFGPDEWNDDFTSAARGVYFWDYFATALSAAAGRGDFGPAAALFGGPTFPPGSDNTYAVVLAVMCTDAPWPTSWTRWATDTWTAYGRNPFVAWGGTWSRAPCRTWPAAPGPRVDVGTTTAPPMLLFDETRDGVTPFSASLDVRRLFPGSVLIGGEGGITHVGSLSGVACVDDRIADYLADGTLPARLPGDRADVLCPAVPPPPARIVTLPGAKAATPGPVDRRGLVGLATVGVPAL